MPTPITKPDYPFIRAWGILQRQPPFQIELAIQLAQDTHAPHDAIYIHWGTYRRSTGSWKTMSDLGSKVRSVLDQIVREAQEPTDA